MAYQKPMYKDEFRPVAIPAGILMYAPAEDKIAGSIVTGNCMEGSGIYDGDMVIVDYDRFPRPGDACACACPYVLDGGPLIKKYDSRIGENLFAVSTNYDFGGQIFGLNGEMQGGFFCDKIYGVVVACMTPDKGLRWEIDPRLLPTEPEDAQPMKGECSFSGYKKEGGAA